MQSATAPMVFVHEDGRGNSLVDAMDVDESIAQLMDLDSFLKQKAEKCLEPVNPDQSESGSESDDEGDVAIEDELAKKEKPQKARQGEYRRTTGKQWEDFFEKKIKYQLSTRAAAIAAGVNVRTATTKWGIYMADPDQQIPSDQQIGNSGRKKKLGEEHTKFIVDYFGDRPEADINELVDTLEKTFENLSISPSTVYRHVTRECHYSLQRLRVHPEARESERTQDLRK
ncbi:hypothetical protein BGZ76_007631, partial [Entomortierella beljakovae]